MGLVYPVGGMTVRWLVKIVEDTSVSHRVCLESGKSAADTIKRGISRKFFASSPLHQPLTVLYGEDDRTYNFYCGVRKA